MPGALPRQEICALQAAEEADRPGQGPEPWWGRGGGVPRGQVPGAQRTLGGGGWGIRRQGTSHIRKPPVPPHPPGHWAASGRAALSHCPAGVQPRSAPDAEDGEGREDSEPPGYLGGVRAAVFQATVLSLEDHISAEFGTLRGWLAAREGEWQERLRRAGSAQLRAMQTNLQELAGKCQAAQEMLTEAQAHLPQQSTMEFLTDIKSFLDWAKQQLATPCGPNTGSQSQTLGQFKGPIQYTAWKNMKSILNIDLPQVTLDPATAHPCLVLSEDRTRVRDGHLRRPLPDTPARFDFCVAVLGAGAFTSGRRYWEVEVGEKPAWTLGVVHASISRKGKIHASPSKGFWVIRLRGGAELMAKDTPPVVLRPQALPHRIGVYLDYEGGQVSFYDAWGMSHLYTFSARFAESVYPYFCPGLYDSAGNSTPLKICPLP
nr:E3 ubiquitin-protein ligase TRIM69-like isoform X2 [Caretta caretta]